MFGKILSIKDDLIIMENTTGETETNIINFHVVFSSNNRDTVGEVISISQKEIHVLLIGEIIDDKFSAGILKKPSLKSGCRLIYKNEVELLLGGQDIANKENLYIGKSSTYDNFNVCGKTNEFLNAHFAILGNTGSGKSCGTARIIQNIFYYNDDKMPINSHIALFDVYGEYNNAFSKLNSLPGISFRSYTTDVKENVSSSLIKIPTFLLDADDLALLLDATEPTQVSIISKALSLVAIFKSEESLVLDWKNNIICTAILDILTSGKNANQIRDQIIAVLTKYNTSVINLEAPIVQPGYVRTLRQCLNIDSQGKMANVHLVVELLEKNIKQDLDPITKNEVLTYNLEDIYYALEFALIGEGILMSDKVFDINNVLKVRLDSIINSDLNDVFDYSDFISLNDYVKKLFISDNGEKVQVINFNFSKIDEKFAKVLTKIFSKIFFNFATDLTAKTSYPIHIILEEAHRYVQNDNDINILGYNIFDRITKEGRKYGIILGLITQRPSELSKTAISQCSNFVVFRMYHPDDLEMIKGITTNISTTTVEKIKDSKPGSAMCFGTAFAIPTLATLELPDPMPISSSTDIVQVWYNE